MTLNSLIFETILSFNLLIRYQIYIFSLIIYLSIIYLTLIVEVEIVFYFLLLYKIIALLEKKQYLITNFQSLELPIKLLFM